MRVSLAAFTSEAVAPAGIPWVELSRIMYRDTRRGHAVTIKTNSMRVPGHSSVAVDVGQKSVFVSLFQDSRRMTSYAEVIQKIWSRHYFRLADHPCPLSRAIRPAAVPSWAALGIDSWDQVIPHKLGGAAWPLLIR
jgi:hypothetical protein